MALRDYPNRVLLAAILSSLLVLGLCGTMAVLLAWEQSRTADVLEENIGRRQAAANVEDGLAALAVLHQGGTKDVTPRHEQAEVHLADVERFADKGQEQELFRRIADSYERYLSLWKKAKDQPGPKTE